MSGPDALSFKEPLQRCPIQEIQVLLICPFLKSKQFPNSLTNRSGEPVSQGKQCVEVDRIPAIWSRYENASTNPADLGRKGALPFAAANVLDNCIGEYDIEFLIIKRERIARIASTSDKAQPGKLLLQK